MQKADTLLRWFKLAVEDVKGAIKTHDHVYLLSFPKCGRTWLNFMLKEAIQKVDLEQKSLSPSLFIDHDQSAVVYENGKQPDPLNLFTYGKRLRYRGESVLLVVRDPRDVIVSHYHQVTKRSVNPIAFNSLSEFVRDPIYGFDRIIRFYQIWEQNMSVPENFLLVRYEDLSNNGVETLSSVCKFIGLTDFSQAELIEIYENSKPDRMRKLEVSEGKSQKISSRSFGTDQNSLKVRKAKVGSYKEELSAADVEYCNSRMKDVPKVYGYST